MALDPVETLQRLIRTPSVNPMGATEWDATMGEGRITDLLVEISREHGWRWTRRQVHPGRDNLLVLIEGDIKPEEGGELILWDVHQDTVAVEGMTIDPFGAELREGRIYGRGASDVKGPMAAMLAALSRARPARRDAEQDPRRQQARPTILLACTVNEECGFTGARAVAQMWGGGRASGAWHESDFVAGEMAVEAFGARPPDSAIVAEPTDLNVVVAHQGVIRWRCHTYGRAAHTSRPDEGLNAIYAMARVVHAIEQYHRDLSTTSPLHPLCGRPSTCATRIHGGVGVNTVPDHATLEIDRRLSPGELPDHAYNELVEYVATNVELGKFRVEHETPFMLSSGLEDRHNRTLAEGLRNLVALSGHDCQIVGVPYGTDAPAIASTGVPTVVFGPGSIAQAHTEDEFLEVSQLERATEIFERIAIEGLRERIVPT